MKKISICIPVLNEEKNIIHTYERIKEIFEKKINNFKYELIFTDNNSKDKTRQIILELCKVNPDVKYIRFRKNLNYDKSILVGYKYSTGDAAIVIDCDLQDPPELFVDFINKWENGYDLVYGEVKSRDESLIINFLRKIFYKMVNLNSYYFFPENAHDFRLIDKSIVEKLRKVDDLFPYVRGITFNLSKKPCGISYNRNKRERGKSKLGLYNSFTYAINAFFEETFIFTKIFRRTTLWLTIILIFFSILNFINSFKYISFFENFVLLILTFICIFLTILTEYISRIYLKSKKIDTNIYEEKINF